MMLTEIQQKALTERLKWVEAIADIIQTEEQCIEFLTTQGTFA